MIQAQDARAPVARNIGGADERTLSASRSREHTDDETFLNGAMLRHSRLTAALLSIVTGCGALAAGLWMAASSAQATPLADVAYPGSPPCSTTLQACIDGAPLNSRIVVAPGVYITSVTVNRAVSVIGGGNGALSVTIRALSGQRVVTVTGFGLTTTTMISGLSLTGGSTSGTGGGILVASSAEPLLSRLIITNNTATFGGGIGVDAAKLNLADSQVLSNSASLYGGGLYSFGAQTADISGTLFAANQSGQYGGGAYISERAQITASALMSNSAGTFGSFYGGGGLYAYVSAQLRDVRIISNSADGDGAGAYFANGDNVSNVTIIGGSVERNTTPYGASYNAGGILLAANATISGTRFLTNAAQNVGGAIFAQRSLTLTNVGVISNSSGSDGGGVYVDGFASSVTARIEGSLFERNTSGRDGGGLCLCDSNSFDRLYMTDTRVIANTTAGDGGGVLVKSAAPVSLLRGEIRANRTSAALSSQGGGLYAAAGGRIDETSVTSNTSGERGAGIYSGAALTLTGVSIISNTLMAGGATVDGAGAFVNGALFAQYGSVSENVIPGTNAGNEGGGAYVLGFASIRQTDFDRNQVISGTGGGLYLAQGGVITSSFLSRNTARAGGSLYTVGPLRLTGAALFYNIAREHGGGAYAASTVVLSQTEFYSNTAVVGGGLFAGGTVVGDGTAFTRNRATDAGGSGGGLMAGQNAALNNSWIDQNSAYQGGGVYVAGTLWLTHAEVLSNTAVAFGGGAMSALVATIDSSVFAGNTSGMGGGAVAGGRALTVTASQFYANRSGRGGALMGATEWASGTLYALNTAFGDNIATIAGASVYVSATRPATILHASIAGSVPITREALVFARGGGRVDASIIASHTVAISSAGALVDAGANLYWRNGTLVQGNTTDPIYWGGIVADPRFINPAQRNYRLGCGSAGFDGAYLFDPIPVDFEGDARPLGRGRDYGFDEAPACVPALSVSDGVALEGNTGLRSMLFTLTLSYSSGITVALEYRTAGQSATWGVDYSDPNYIALFDTSPLEVPLGIVTWPFTLGVIGDTAIEGNESFTLAVSFVSPGAVIGDGSAFGVIIDNDGGRAMLPRVLR